MTSAMTASRFSKATGKRSKAAARELSPQHAELAKLQAVAAEQGRKGLSPERLGRSILTALSAAKPKVRYVVTPEPVLNFVVNRAPKRTVDRLIAGRLGLMPAKGGAR